MLYGEHAVIYGYPCIVTAVDHRLTVSLKKTKDLFLRINAPDVDIYGYSLPIKHLNQKLQKMPVGVRFAQTAVRNFIGKYGVELSGLSLTSKNQFSSKFGFGSSSAVTVATIKALAEIYSVKLEKKQLFDLAYKTVLDVAGVGSGFDLAAAIWGGTIYFANKGEVIETLTDQQIPLVVGYSGTKADTPALVRQVADFRGMHTEITDSIFKNIGILVERAKNYVSAMDLKKMGELMRVNQGLLDALGVNTARLSQMIFAAVAGGAYGAKLSGAGGGDCMIACYDGINTEPIKESMHQSTAIIIDDVRTGAEGVRIEA